MPLPVRQVGRHDAQLAHQQVQGPPEGTHIGVGGGHKVRVRKRFHARLRRLRKSAAQAGLGQVLRVGDQLNPVLQGEALPVLLLRQRGKRSAQAWHRERRALRAEAQGHVRVHVNLHGDLNGVRLAVECSKGDNVVRPAVPVGCRHVRHEPVGVRHRMRDALYALAAELVQVPSGRQSEQVNGHLVLNIRPLHLQQNRFLVPRKGVRGVVCHNWRVVDRSHADQHFSLHREIPDGAYVHIHGALQRVHIHRNVGERVVAMEVSIRNVNHLAGAVQHKRSGERNRAPVALVEHPVLRHRGDGEGDGLLGGALQENLHALVLTSQRLVAEGRGGGHPHSALWHVHHRAARRARRHVARRLVETEISLQACLVASQRVLSGGVPLVRGVRHVGLRDEAHAPDSQLVNQAGEALAHQHV
mmetsp:Transcript_13985/g.26853  ORF Transcript_13985/g.26853 Transcript_13985/m.26853 type:complete len:415 (+) Transcript_13985:5792-7036(+)